jgi:hypothetical protein
VYSPGELTPVIANPQNINQNNKKQEEQQLFQINNKKQGKVSSSAGG